MTTTAQSIIRRVTETLFDVTSVRWTVDRLVRYLNDGQREIVSNRPDAMNTAASLNLVAGAKQSIPSDGEKLIVVLANNATSKRACTKVDRALLDNQIPGWRGLTGSTEILHWMFDPLEPKAFEIYPPAAASGAVLMIEYAKLPTDIVEPAAGSLYTAVTGDISVGDLFGNALQDYILYRCHAENTQYAQPARAQAHYAAFGNALGVELKATVALGAASDQSPAAPA